MLQHTSSALKRMRAKYFAASELAESVIQQILMDIQEYDRILEIGTGNGSMFKQIIGQLEKGSLKSIETSKRKIRKTQRANRSVIKAGRGNIQQGRPESLPFRDRSFHKVFSLHTAETVSDYRTACKEVYRVLQIDGCFYMVLKPSRMSEKDVIEVLYDQHFRDISVVSRDSFHFITAIK
ncbi:MULTISPECIES: class I SAM-dependent methyltransferase [Bacillus]|jgi:ubiquinone/menaquinone biosynthesis C-methylase UbiE|uniref:class I SAM-dependent methyltransferase n=1 Tax=Bacillus TaxID=1386 RepID=UPI00099B8550|nr:MULTISPECIES: methyltransferase domain-containing protein [Bacillus amyloliquefaciens group]ASZ04387.1 class I SAM-dependent methyltransferase [Bacillus velezensis]MCB5334347.1 putative methyltransferase YrhH [Bacillus amyloliquefaciens]MCC5596075.1 class I SAM-dependent methyltransferase [Bacillus velezensis]MDV2629969.1 methyltransferase domain-containing protein [Bacillus velezensis]OPD43190.1 SAM-dependent methyltransferase [Bacillus amyloliquefaciens]